MYLNVISVLASERCPLAVPVAAFPSVFSKMAYLSGIGTPQMGLPLLPFYAPFIKDMNALWMLFPSVRPLVSSPKLLIGF
jgi:hypothetical protein